MKNEIKIPSLGESISEATIGQILAPSGTIVKADAEILEIETDKVNQVLYAPQAGQVQLTVKSGESVKIGQVIGTIDSVSEEQKKEEKELTSSKQEINVQVSQEKQETVVSDGKPELKTEKIFTSDSSPINVEGAIRYQKDSFLQELKNLPTDVMRETKESSSKAVPSVKQVQSNERETRRPMSNIRRVIAKKLVEAQQTMAMLTTFNEIDLTHVIQLREKYKETFIKKYGVKLGFMSFFVKAVVSALQTFPDLNSYIDGEEIVHREYYDIGVAVGTDKGVIVPIIRYCDQLSFAEIEQLIESYAKKAREGSLVANDLQGGGFTITNGGTYGSLLSTPILLPPQCGILGMHKIEKRPIAIENDQIVVRSMMYVALSYDHRLIDGKEAVSFLVHIKNLLEDPSRFILNI